MVEFKQDVRDGTLRLMEINGRFWGSLQLAIDSGVDFPSLAVEIATNQTAPTTVPSTYHAGTKSRWLAGDLDALLAIMFHSRRALNLAANHPGRLRSLWLFMRSFSGDVLLEIERAGDSAPARLEWRRWLLGTR